MPTEDDPQTELAAIPAGELEELDLRVPVDEPWSVVDGLADWRALPPTSPTPPTTHLPFLTTADTVRRDTLESEVKVPEATPTAPRPPPPRPAASADEQRRIATVLQLPLEEVLRAPGLDVRATPTAEIARPRLGPKVTEEQWLVRIVVGTLVLVCLVFIVTLLWPDSRATPARPITSAAKPPPPPPPPAPSVNAAPLDEWSLDPTRHRVDTLAVHARDLPAEPRHRYLVSVDRLPKGALVAARLNDVKEGWGALFGVAPGRVLAVHGVRSLRLHCEPPETFTTSTALEVHVVDTTTKASQLITLNPSVDCLDLGAGRAVRLTESLRLAVSPDPRRTLKVAYAWRGAEGAMAAGMLTPGQTARLEPGLVQLAVVSHSVSDSTPVKFSLGPADVAAPQESVQYLTPSLAPVRAAPPPKPAPKPVELDVWPRAEH